MTSPSVHERESGATFPFPPMDGRSQPVLTRKTWNADDVSSLRRASLVRTASWLLGLRWRVQAQRSLALALAVVLVSGLVFGVLAADRVLHAAVPEARRRAVLLGLLRDDVTEGERTALVRGLRELPAVEDVRLVSSQEALGRLKSELGEHAGLLDNIEEGFVPPSLEITLVGGARLGADVQALSARLRQAPALQGVDVWSASAEPSTERWIAVARAGRALALLVVGLLLISAWLMFVASGHQRVRAEQRVLRSFGLSVPVLLVAKGVPALGGLSLGLAAAGMAGWWLVTRAPRFGGAHDLRVALSVGAAWGVAVVSARALRALSVRP